MARWMSRRSELEFLPAAIEIVETPASPAGRAIALLIVAFLACAIVWAWVGTVDIVAVAQGKIVPTGRTKVIQPLEIGVIRAIHIEDGQHVQAGDLLVEMDPTDAAADRDRLARELMTAKLDVARLTAAVANGDPAANFSPPPEADAALVRVQKGLLESQVTEQENRLAALDRQLEQQSASMVAIQAEIKKFKRSLPLIKDRYEAKHSLLQNGLAPKSEVSKLQEELIAAQQDMAAAQARLVESKAALASLERQRDQAAAEYRRQRFADLAEAENRVANTGQELLKARQRAGLQQLTAPIPGVVQQLAIHTIGGVVTPAQPLMIIVPDDSHLEIEAQILNKDIGFVRKGQRAAIKLEAFPFTRYGLIDGSISGVSGDAVQVEKSGLVYLARIAIDHHTMNSAGRTVELEPGMAATVEIKTGKRRIIDYLLSPIARYQQESMREQ